MSGVDSTGYYGQNTCYREHFGEPSPFSRESSCLDNQGHMPFYEGLARWSLSLNEENLKRYHEKWNSCQNNSKVKLMDAQECLMEVQNAENTPSDIARRAMIVTKASFRLIEATLWGETEQEYDELLLLALITNPSLDLLQSLFDKGGRLSNPLSQMLGHVEQNERGLRRVLKVLRELAGFGESTEFPFENFSEGQIEFVFNNLASQPSLEETGGSFLCELGHKYPDVNENDYKMLSDSIENSNDEPLEALIALMAMKAPIDLIKKLIECKRGVVMEESWPALMQAFLTTAICFNPNSELLKYLIVEENAAIPEDFLKELRKELRNVEPSYDGLESAAIRQFKCVVGLILKFIPYHVDDEAVRYIFDFVRQR